MPARRGLVSAVLLTVLVAVLVGCGSMESKKSTQSGVAVVGDSLTVPIAGALTKDLEKDGWKDVRVDAQVGRAMSSSALVPSGITAIKALKRKGFDPPEWIVALGT